MKAGSVGLGALVDLGALGALVDLDSAGFCSAAVGVGWWVVPV